MSDLGPRRARHGDDVAGVDHVAPRPARAVAAPRHAGSPAPRTRRWRTIAVVLLALVLAAAITVGVALTRERVTHTTPQPEPTSADPVARTRAPGTPEQVGDTVVTVPAAWRLYADEITDGDRRLIRLREPGTDLTMQITTLTSVGEELGRVCEVLVKEQRDQFVVHADTVPQPIAVTGGHATVCGFRGERGGVEESVQFTIVQRDADAHTLVLRTIRPTQVDARSTAMSEAARLSCEAARNFEAPLPLC